MSLKCRCNNKLRENSSHRKKSRWATEKNCFPHSVPQACHTCSCCYPHFTSQQVRIYVVHFLSANACWIKPSTFPGLKAAQVLIYPWLSVRDAIIPADLKELHSSLKPSFSGLITMILPSCRTVLQDNHTWNGFSIHVLVQSKNGWEIIRVQSYSSLQFSRVLAPYSL